MLKYRDSYEVNRFEGLLTEFKDVRQVPDGYSPDALNWITQTDKQGIELRRGWGLLGKTKRSTPGVTGLGVGTRFDGEQVPFFAAGRKLFYYDKDTDETIEIGNDTLPAAAVNDVVSIFPYQNIAGAFVYASSPNSSIYKIPVANPGHVVDQQVTEYRGFFKFGQSRGFLYNRQGDNPGNFDRMGLYTSKVDKVDLSQYPAQVVGEVIGTGDGTEQTFTASSLAQITGKRTAMFVLVTDGTETFRDDRNGNLIGSAGGTGTINYATGAISVTFNTAPANAQNVTASYYYEDATSGGVCDFSITNPADRQPGEGNYFPQFDGGGPLHSVFPLATVFYCFHELKTWQVTIPVDDASGEASIATNLPFRERMGVSSDYGAFGGENGIYFVNTADPGKPEFMRLEMFTGATAANIAAPRTISDVLDLSLYSFKKAIVIEWGDFIIFSCARIRNGVADNENTRMFIYNKKSRVWDLTDNPASVLAIYNGSLLAGDPVTGNVYTLFSGWDDDDNIINENYWTGGETTLGMPGQKRFTRFVVEGLIQSSQEIAIDFAYDGGNFIETFVIKGNGQYVDTGSSVSIGANTVGSKTVGGGSIEFANQYRVEIRVQSDKFNYIRPRFRALGGGYASINRYEYKDIRQKSLRSRPERTA